MSRIFLGIVLVSFITSAAFGALSISFESSRVVASGVTRGGRVVFVGVAHEPREYWTNIVHRQVILTDVSGTGTVILDLHGPVYPDSAWAVVDLTTGEAATGAPAGSPFTPVTFPAGSIRRNDSGDFTNIVEDGEYIDLVLVRPREGAWLFYGEDGHSNDRDHARNGRTTIEPEGMQRIGDSPEAPKHLRNGDRLILLAPYIRTMATAEVGR